jgi:hypothetical protein
MRVPLGIVGLLFAGAGLAYAGFLDVLLPKSELQVITVTDMPPDGAAMQPPSPDKPVYYAAVCVGYRDFAASIAGDKLPKRRTW